MESDEPNVTAKEKTSFATMARVGTLSALAGAGLSGVESHILASVKVRANAEYMNSHIDRVPLDEAALWRMRSQDMQGNVDDEAIARAYKKAKAEISAEREKIRQENAAIAKRSVPNQVPESAGLGGLLGLAAAAGILMHRSENGEILTPHTITLEFTRKDCPIEKMVLEEGKPAIIIPRYSVKGNKASYEQVLSMAGAIFDFITPETKTIYCNLEKEFFTSGNITPTPPKPIIIQPAYYDELNDHEKGELPVQLAVEALREKKLLTDAEANVVQQAITDIQEYWEGRMLSRYQDLSAEKQKKIHAVAREDATTWIDNSTTDLSNDEKQQRIERITDIIIFDTMANREHRVEKLAEFAYREQARRESASADKART